MSVEEMWKRVCTVLPTNGSRVELQQYREKKFDVELFYQEKEKKKREKKKNEEQWLLFLRIENNNDHSTSRRSIEHSKEKLSISKSHCHRRLES